MQGHEAKTQRLQEQGTKNEFEVTPAEGGQKLLQFLQRRLALPPTLLHRWVRTGQIRRNGGRCKPFDHVDAGDMVRLPPFALAMNQSAQEDKALRQQRTEEAENAPRASRQVRQGNTHQDHTRQGYGHEDGHTRQGYGHEDGHTRQGYSAPHQDRPNRPAPRVGQLQAGTPLPPPYRQLQRSTTPPQPEDSPQTKRGPKQREVTPQLRGEDPQAHSATTSRQLRAHGHSPSEQFAQHTAHSPIASPTPSPNASPNASPDAPQSSPYCTSAPSQPCAPAFQSSPSLPPIIHADEHLLVINKPAGLPVHPGTGHSDSLTTRLAQHFAHAPFRPTPAHRLDKDTSGLLLVASAYRTLRALQEAFLHRHMIKEYVAWVQGIWTEDTPVVLRHQLAKQYVGSNEKMRVVNGGVFSGTGTNADASSAPDANTGTASVDSSARSTASDTLPTQGKEAVCVVQCLRRVPATQTTPTANANEHATEQAQAPALSGHSLMHIRLITGRTHQIRAQLAAVGHPLCGDFKYGATMQNAEPATCADLEASAHQITRRHLDHALHLHSLRIILPDVPELAHVPREFAVLPPWQGVLALQAMPPPLTVPAS